MKRKLSNHRTQLSGIIIMCLLLAVMWACRKERSLEIEPDLSEEVTALSNWYKRQLIPTDNPESFAKMNQPLWSGTKMINKGDTLLFTTLLFSKEKITRELHVRYYDGVYNGVVRQYDFGFTDSLSAGTFTLNGRLIDMGYFDATNTYTLTVLAGNRNLVLMGTETINGGKLPEANVPAPPKNPSPPIWIPPTSPVGPPPGPSYPPPGWGSGGGGGTSTSSSAITNFNNNIDETELLDCMDKVLDTLKTLNGNSVADIIQKFAGELPGYKLKFAQELKGGEEGLTQVAWVNNEIKDGYVTINFNTYRDVLQNVTDVAAATTMLHESVHAYLYAYYKDDPASATATYPELFKKYIFKKAGINSNTTQHNQMAKTFINDIATSLIQYGKKMKYTMNDSFYKDLAWKGLTDTDAFKSLSDTDRKRITDIIKAEQYGIQNIAPKGKKLGC